MEEGRNNLKLEELRTEPVTKATKWIKDNPFTFVFFALIIFTFAVKLNYFYLTYNQPLWWDEADYMNMARAWLGFDYWDISQDAVRPILFPAIASIFMLFGLGEISIRFFILLTSIASIILLYGIGNLFFSKRIALLSSFILAIFWSFSFYSFRLLVDVPVTMLWLATIYFFFNAYFKEKSWKHYALAGIFLGLSFLMKFSSITLVLIFAFYLLTTEKLKILRNKKIYVFFLVSLITILPLFIYQYSIYGNPMQFITPSGTESSPPNTFIETFKSLMLQIPYLFKKTYIFVFAFFLGLLLILYSFSQEKQIFTKKTLSNNYYFLILWIFLSLAFFARLYNYNDLIYGGSYLDERYYFVFYPAIFLIAGIGLVSLYTYIKAYQKQFALIILIVFLLVGVYQHLTKTDEIIKTKKDSFLQLKLAGNYLKANTAPQDIIFILEEQSEISYYAQRKYVNIAYDNSSSITGKIKQHKPKYIVMSFFLSLKNKFSQDIINYVGSNSDIFIPVQAYPPYLDKEQKMPLAVIFKINSTYYQSENYI